MPDINEDRPWSPRDDEDLRLAIASGDAVDRVATFLCRPVEEVLKRPPSSGCAGTVQSTSNCGAQIRDGCHVGVRQPVLESMGEAFSRVRRRPCDQSVSAWQS
jgi:hypothetical protein